MLRIIRLGFGILIFVIAMTMLLWGEWQFPRQIKTTSINPAEFQLSNTPSGISLTTGLKSTEIPISTQRPETTQFSGEISAPSTHRLILEAPTKIRAGDTDVIHLTITSDGSVNHNNAPPTPGKQGESPSIYKTYNLLAETRLDLNGILFTPTGDIMATFQPDEAVSIYWTVQPENPGDYQGVVWLHFQYVAKDKTEILRRLVSTQLIEMTSVSFWGLRGDVTRLIGGTGIFVGLALDLDLLFAIFHKLKRGKGNKLHA